jgi:hypothetical protein
MGNRKLPLVCASNGDYSTFYTEPCQRAACHYWSKEQRACTAGQGTAEVFSRWFTPARDVALPACPIEPTCAWNVAAVQAGDPGCVVRRLGMLCEHQGGDWNTFDVAEPDDPVWGLDDKCVGECIDELES